MTPATRVSRYQPVGGNSTTHLSAVGAVVIGRNEGERLIHCLKSLVKNCDYVVYVDSGSSDGSLAAANRLGADVVELDLDTPFTAGRARNAGFDYLDKRRSHLELIQFVDGDCEVLPDWLASATQFLEEHPEVALVCGRRCERFPEASIYNAMCHREWDTPIGPAHACGGDFLIRRDVFRQAQGFADELIAHEEPEFCGRLRAAGHKIWRMEEAMTLHDAAIYRFSQFYRRNRRAGFGITQVVLRSGWSIDPNGASILRRAYIWALFPPLAAVLLALWLGPLSFAVLLLYPAQILRHALLDQQKVGGRLMYRIYAATVALVCKLAETHGSLEFLTKYILGRRISPIYYKS
jgi:GT2 family glycosyltransferase